jgi:hypothetical protein
MSDTLNLEVIEIFYMQYRDTKHELHGKTAELIPAYAVGMNGRVVISSRSEQPDWSFEREEIERRIAEMKPAPPED